MQAKNTWTIRSAVLADTLAIFALIRSHHDDLISRPVGDIVENIDRFVVAQEDGEIVGCASWKILPEIGSPEHASVEIQSVAVREGHRRQGVGAGMVGEILQRIKRFSPAHAIVLTFAPEFFGALGFKEIPKTNVMHKLYMGCINCTKHANPFTCPEIAMSLDLSLHKKAQKEG